MHQICLILKQFIIVHKTQSNLQQHEVTGKTKIIVEDGMYMPRYCVDEKRMKIEK